MQNNPPQIPDAATAYYLNSAGFEALDGRLWVAVETTTIYLSLVNTSC